MEKVDAESLPVFGTIAAQFNDDGVNAAIDIFSLKSLLTMVLRTTLVFHYQNRKPHHLEPRSFHPNETITTYITRTLRSYHANVESQEIAHLHQALTGGCSLPEANRDVLEQRRY